MAIDNVIIDSLKPYNTSKYESFEMLWYQLCNELYGNKGVFTPIDDSGGGDGVEFYLKLSNGDIWGWQCKFFDRFSESGRKTQIIKSLEKACKEHKKSLKKWFLCSKSDCTPNEQKWFAEELPKACKDYKIEIFHLGDSELLKNLANYPNIENFFFGNDRLPLNWFESHAESVFSRPSIRNKYISDVHAVGNTQNELNCYIGGTFLADILRQDMALGSIDKVISDYPKILREIQKLEMPSNLQSMKQDIISHLIENEHIFEDGKKLLLNLQERLTKSSYGSPFLGLLKDTDIYYERVSAFVKWETDFLVSNNFLGLENLDIPEDKTEDRIKSKYSIIQHIEGILDNIEGIWKSIAYIFYQIGLLAACEIHIKGGAAKGKSHIVLNVFDQYRIQKLPAVYLSAKDFSSNDQVDTQLLRILDIPKSWSTSDFLGYLDQSGKEKGCKSLMIIDGLNESPYYNSIWKNGIENLVTRIKQFTNILLITTFRSSYQQALFDTFYNYNKFLVVSGFDYQNFDDVIEKYLKHFEIVINDHSQARSFFRFEPLALRLFCEVNRGRKVSLSQETLFKIFEEYISSSNYKVLEKLGKDPRFNRNYLSQKLLLIAKYMWDNNVNKIPLSKDIGIDQTELYAICYEDLLVDRDWCEEEFMGFTYDLMGGYIIAKYLIDGIDSFDKFISAFNDDLGKRLMDNQYSHPLYDDITYCLLVLALQKFQFTDEKLFVRELQPYLVKALFTTSKDSILKQNHIVYDFLNKALISNQEYLQEAQCCAFIPNHPFNFDFVCNVLKSMEVAQRDLWWTAYQSTYKLDENLLLVRKLYDSCQTTTDENEISHITAKYVMWLLASNSHKLRFESTKALFYYGRLFPDDFLSLLSYSMEINDLYVPERMLAVFYGLALHLQNGHWQNLTIGSFLIPAARLVYNSLYSDDAILFTTHSFIRAYARKTIQLANKLVHNTFSKGEIENVFRKCSITKDDISKWEKVKEFGGPIQMDFSNYSLGSLIPDGNSYSDPELKQQGRGYIYHRISELGWEEKLFDDVEKTNKNFNYVRRGDDEGINKIDRFGKKYSWIAFYELVGILSDNGLLDKEYSYWTEVYPDIDPTFPLVESEYEIVFDHLLHDEMDFKTWFENDKEEEFSNLYIRHSLNNDESDYVCLYGYFTDKNESNNKSRFTFIRPLICKSKDFEKLSERLRLQDFSGRWFPDTITNYNCYVGEMFMWAESTYSNWIDLEFRRDKFEIEREENKHLCLADQKLKDYMSYQGKEEKCKLLDEIGNELSFEPEKEIEIKALIPTMDYRMECDGDVGTHSVIAKEIAFSESLCWMPQTFNLSDQKGKTVTKYIHYSHNESYYKFVYLRKDVIDSFLKKNDCSMLFCVWGEREPIARIEWHGFKQIEPYKFE